MNAPSTTGKIPTTAPIALWRAASAFMHILHAIFGAPADVAAGHTLTLKAHQLMASWLRCGEAMMRRLLVIEAAAYAKPNTRPLLRVSRQRPSKPVSFTPEKPETWRVSFRCFMERGRPRPQHGAVAPDTRAGTPALHTRPFIFRDRDFIPRAERTPTFKRVRRKIKRTRRKPILRQEREWVLHQEKLTFRSALPLAKRYEAMLRVFNDPLAYARRLSRHLHATPHRLREILRAPPEAANRIDRYAELSVAAESSAAVFNSS